jgi:ABC-type nitrate/sulfonate/bicarbonate transport system permease component
MACWATVIELLRPMPSVAIIPVAILLLGIGDAMIVAVTVYASLWPVLINTIDGVRHIDGTLIDTGRTFGLARGRILWQIILPGASPYIVTGLRIGLSIALILVTTAEMIAGSKGLGFYILDEERGMNSANMYAGIVVVALLGYLLNLAFLDAGSQSHALASWHDGAGDGLKWLQAKFTGPLVSAGHSWLSGRSWRKPSGSTALIIPPPSKISKIFSELVVSGQIPWQILASMKRAVGGLFSSLPPCLFRLGVLMGLSQRIYRLLEVVVEVLRPVPPPVVIPVALLFFGLGDEMKIFVIFFSCAWPILLNTIDGVRGP